ncbi:hypothetical protein HanHA300_Chr05g0185811 [Helianthus annuus]|nr:hypothetical protein HanHA300_Chr05g0185811 [Helianthus annuus]KAJ0578488.1 hypothetical protein HanIR_Chr05g0248481 [Helianthus annuus]KAJ0748048.1 hypothetical protein HanOQP8_Chr05g0196611 [Helianthus annuus]
MFQTNACFVVLVAFLQNTMSWFSNNLFGEYSDQFVVPDSHERTAIFDSYEKPVSSNMREEEIVSGIRYRDNTMQLDLNIPVEDSYAQHGYSNYGYGGEPYPQVEYPYVQTNYPNHGYGGVQMYVQQDYPDQLCTTRLSEPGRWW